MDIGLVIIQQTTKEKDRLFFLFGYDTNDNAQVFICPHRSYIKYNVKYPTNEKDIFGRYVETRYFDNIKKSQLSKCV